MFKTKLFAGICAGASVITAAVTALTLAISGPAETKAIHQYSPNEQVQMSLESAFNSMSNTTDELTQFVNVISTNKTAANLGFTINYAEGYDELTGVGGEVEFQLDTEAEAAAIILSAALGNVDVIDGTIYIDKNELIASAPAIFDGIITAKLDNLEEDLQNSYMGQYLLESMDIDIDEFKLALEMAMNDYETYMPQFEFDSEKFYAGLNKTLTESYNTTMSSMELEDLGKEDLNGGSYQCYNVKISVTQLSYILKDAIIYCMESPEFQSLVDQFIEYYVETTGESIPELEMISGESLGQYVSLVDLYWGQLVTELENTIGKDIAFKIYIADTVELAGLEINMYQLDDKISFDDADAANSSEQISITYDITGGKHLGDYTELTFKGTSDTDYVDINYTLKNEPNGDFDMSLTLKTPVDDAAITANGNYVVDGEFFNLDVESVKLIEDGTTLYDFGFKCGFKPIDSITKPTGAPVYDLWEMDEADLNGFLLNVYEKLQELSGIIG